MKEKIQRLWSELDEAKGKILVKLWGERERERKDEKKERICRLVGRELRRLKRD